MTFDPAPAAAELMRRRAAGEVAGPLPPAIAPTSVEQGVAVQHAMARQRGAIPPGGFKIGATGTRMQRHLRIESPIAGFIRAEDVFASGATLPYARFRVPQVECELAVRLARDLPPGPTTIEQARDAVADLLCGIEIVENRYGPPPIGDLELVGVPTLVADQMYHAACVVGPSFAGWRDVDPPALRGAITIDGVERDRGVGADLLGDPLQALAWLAGSVFVVPFGGLRAGQVVMLGSVTPSITLDGPAHVRVVFDGLPEVELRLA